MRSYFYFHVFKYHRRCTTACSDLVMFPNQKASVISTIHPVFTLPCSVGLISFQILTLCTDADRCVCCKTWRQQPAETAQKQFIMVCVSLLILIQMCVSLCWYCSTGSLFWMILGLLASTHTQAFIVILLIPYGFSYFQPEHSCIYY